MEVEWRERVEEEKARTGAAVEKQPLSFEKEEAKCNDSGASFVACAKEDKARSLQEDISALMKRSGAEMRDSVEAATKEARAGFIEAVNVVVKEAESELHRRRDNEEAARVDEEDDLRRRAQDEEETSSSVRSSVADELLAAAAEKAEGERLRAVEEMIASVTAYKDRYMEEEVERAITEF